MDFIDFYYKLRTCLLITKNLISSSYVSQRKVYHLINQLHIMGIGSLAIVLLTSCFIGMIFTFQIARELTYLNATRLVGSILTVTFLRELSPVLTAVIVTGRIGSAYTAEIASMQVTNQIDVLYVLRVDPIEYLIKPRIFACVLMLPILNIISLVTSVASSIYISAYLYSISPMTFIISSYSSLSMSDLCCSLIKTCIFGLIIGIISCTWGVTTRGGSVNVGKSTTSSVVTTLLVIFISDFFLSLLMFRNSDSLFY
uniref:ABC transporter permease n=1 Tax=Dermonema virens TaxID=1077399 RepID=A0A1G4NRK0_9FLOR|nr:Hypothetical protein ycf63 [Dermonema virens]SCW21281.1 Hypothetical protein ycf63 [Dermonema virens]